MNKIVNNQISSIIIEALEVRNCTRKELVEKINQSLPESKSMDSSVISGVIKSMKESGKIKNISWGVYQKGDENQNHVIQSKVNRMVNEFRRGLDRAYTVNLLHMKECDKDFIVKIQGIVNKFDTEIKDAYSEYDNSINNDMDQEYPVPNKQDTSDSSKGTIKQLERK